MRHKLCRSFHPWCPGVKTRCLLLLLDDIGIDHDTVYAGVVWAVTPGTVRVEPAVARPLANHSSADRMSGQFLFYHENEAIHNDKSRGDHDDEPPCWNALAGNAIVMMKVSIDTVSE